MRLFASLIGLAVVTGAATPVWAEAPPKPVKRIQVEAVDRPLYDILADFGREYDVRIKIEPGLPNPVLGIGTSGGRTIDFLRNLARLASVRSEPIRVVREGEGWLFRRLARVEVRNAGTPPDQRLRGPLPDVRLSEIVREEFSEQPLAEVLARLFEGSTVRCILPPDAASMRVTVKLNDEPVYDGLFRAFQQVERQSPDAALLVQGGAYRIAFKSDETRDQAVSTILEARNRHTTYKNVPFRRALRFLLQQTGLAFDVDPSVDEAVFLTLATRDCTVREALNTMVTAYEMKSGMKLQVKIDGDTVFVAPRGEM